jgi:ketosteroid isomerase-like protein
MATAESRTVKPEDDDATVGRLRALLDAHNAHDLDAIVDLFADDAVLDMPRGPDAWGLRFEGRAAIRVALARRFERMPDLKYTDAKHFASGDSGCSVWTLTGTTRDGAPVEIRGCDVYEFHDGKVVRKDSYWKIRD